MLLTLFCVRILCSTQIDALRVKMKKFVAEVGTRFHPRTSLSKAYHCFVSRKLYVYM